MSRRHRGRPHHHAPAAGEAPRRGFGPEPTGPVAPDANLPRTAAAAPPRTGSVATGRGSGQPEPARPVQQRAQTETAATSPLETRPIDAPPAAPLEPAPSAPVPNCERTGQCTAPQLRRFIKSRPYVPMHELRRRFAINGDDDDVTPVRMNPGFIYVGLPMHEGHLLGDLLRTGEIGYELSLDPRTPIVIGVYPMRPIPRN